MVSLQLFPSSIFIVVLLSFQKGSAGCYTSIISFGDSYTDTGNGMLLEHSKCYQSLPYGESFKYGPTGRCSNGRLIIDLIAQAMGLPFVPPYLGGAKEDFKQGVNFAVVGATAMDPSFFQERGVVIYTNYSLGVQLKWFQQLAPSLCNSRSNCQNLFKNALFLVGVIGGNDYYRLLYKTSRQDIRAFVPLVVSKISAAVSALINEGAVTLLVPGLVPSGCAPYYLTVYQSQDINEYDAFGCLKWVNELAQFHNRLLQDELTRLRELHPHVTIMYADYYNAAILLYHKPYELGFSEGALRACCGGGGPYNYNTQSDCGAPGSTVCDDASLYVGWDGSHLTEAAYKLVVTRLLGRSFIIPPIELSCVSVSSY